MQRILPEIETLEQVPFDQELLRKGIHLISLSIPVIYSFTTKEFALSILIPLTILGIILDFLSRKKNKLQEMIHLFFGKMMRPHEFEDRFILNGASWVLLSACICIFIFPKIIAVTSFSILIISDISAALFGKKFGRHHFLGKTIEGSLAFFVSAVVVVYIIYIITSAPDSFFLFGIIAALIGMAAEAVSKLIKIDDNITIPLCVGFVLWGGDFITLSMYGQTFLSLIQ